MTLSSVPAKEIKLGNDVATTFSFTFVINQAEDLVVTFTDVNGNETILTEGTGTNNYSINVSNYPGVGSITYPATLGTELATGEKLTLARVVDLDQETDLQNQARYKPEAVEAAFDYGRMIDLQQQDQLDRSIKVPISDNSGADYTLPAPTADRAIGVWNSDGTAIVIGPTASEISSAQTFAAAAEASKDAAETAEAGAIDAQAAAEAAASGMVWRPSVRVATTANITLSGTQTIDGIAVVANDRVLVKDQSSAPENGVYIVAAGAWSRASDADTWDELVSQVVSVQVGTVNADLSYICTADSGGTLDTTDVNWQALNLPAGSVTNAKLADMAQATVKGRAAGAGTGSPTDLTPAQVRAAADVYSTSESDSLTGTLVARGYDEYTATTDLGGSDIPWDSTAPTDAEGTEILSITHTAASASNRIRLQFTGVCATNGGIMGIAVIFKDSTPIQVITQENVSGMDALHLSGFIEIAAGDTSSHDYSVRVGGSTGATNFWMNRGVAGETMGGNLKSVLSLDEMKA